MKQWIPLKIVLITGLFMMIQYFIPNEHAEFFYEYMIDFTIIIGIFALALGIWSLVRVSWEKIRRKAPGAGYAWVILFGLVAMLFFGLWPTKVGNVGDTPEAVALGDMDFDNDNDIVVANYDSDNISLFKNRGNGLFIPAYTYKAGKTPKDLVLADLDKDNDMDVVVANESAGTISVLINASNPQTFSRMRLQITPDDKIDSIFNVGRVKLEKPAPYLAGDTPVAVARGDLNGDGYLDDIVAANKGSNNISVFLNNGDGTFKDAVNYPVGTAPVDVYVADFNRDLINDIVVANQGSSDVSLLLGDGRGGFQAAENFGVEGGSLTSLATGDFDNNGYFDLAVTLANEDQPGTILVMKSDSTGIFSSGASYPTGIMPVSIDGGDINRDPYRDLAVVTKGDNLVWAYKNDSTGAFGQSFRYFSGRSPDFVTMGFLITNGRTSLITTNEVSNNIATFTNRGNFDFEPGASLESGDILFIGGRLSNYFYRAFFDNIMIPIQATMFSLLAFYIASAAYRAFRARTLLSSILLVAALIIMIRFVPLGPISDGVSALSGWILKVPNMAAKRAIFIGVGLGMVATAVKVLLGVERGYMGRD
jgi:hypothetical protein